MILKSENEAHFVSKLTDCDGENSETDTWLDFGKDCGYMNNKEHERLTRECEEIKAMFGPMLNKPFAVSDQKPANFSQC